MGAPVHPSHDPEERVKQEKERERMSLSIDQILANEGLIKQDMNKGKQLWHRCVEKVLTLTTQRHFSDSRIQVDMKGFRIEIIDNSEPAETPVSLIGLQL